MRETLRRWTENETVGHGLIAAGLIFLVVQVLPSSAVAWLRHAWPLALVAAGALLLWRRPARS